MSLKTILKASEKFLIDNSPGILTGLGVAGTVSTAILAGKGAYSAALRITEADEVSLGETNAPLDTKEKFQLVWKEFVPAAAVGTVTIVSIVMANQIGSRRGAAIAAALKISEELSADYKKKVLQTVGLQREEKMRSELAGERMAKNPPPPNMLIVTGANTLFYDERSARYFHSTMDHVMRSVNEVNHQVNNYFCASLTEFYDKIGLDATAESDSVGWNTHELMDVQYSPVLFENKQSAVMIGYNIEPIGKFDRVS